MSRYIKVALSLVALLGFISVAGCGPKVDMGYAKPFPATTTMQKGK